MLKNVMKCLCLSATLLAGYCCLAAAPVKIKEVAPVADLVTEAEAKIKAIEEALASEDKYQEAKATALVRDAAVLAVLSQAIAESEEKAAWKASAPDLRDAAIGLGGAKSFDDAKKALAAIKEAHGGKAGGAKLEAEWNKLGKFGAVMKEVNVRNGRLRRYVRKLPDNPNDAARDASVLAVLALVAHDDTHEVKQAADVPEWQSLSKEFQSQMTAAAAAFNKKDAAGAKAGFDKANAACNSCHKKFRDME